LVGSLLFLSGKRARRVGERKPHTEKNMSDEEGVGIVLQLRLKENLRR